MFHGPTKLPDGTYTPAKLILRNPFARSKAIMPGFVLLALGISSFIANGTMAIKAYADPEAFAERTQNEFGQMAEQKNMQSLREQIPAAIEWIPRIRATCAILGVVTVIGSIGMIRQRWYILAVLGCIAAMANIANICFILGVPIGGWGLLVILSREVKSQFR